MHFICGKLRIVKLSINPKLKYNQIVKRKTSYLGAHYIKRNMEIQENQNIVHILANEIKHLLGMGQDEAW